MPSFADAEQLAAHSGCQSEKIGAVNGLEGRLLRHGGRIGRQAFGRHGAAIETRESKRFPRHPVRGFDPPGYREGASTCMASPRGQSAVDCARSSAVWKIRVPIRSFHVHGLAAIPRPGPKRAWQSVAARIARWLWQILLPRWMR